MFFRKSFGTEKITSNARDPETRIFGVMGNQLFLNKFRNILDCKEIKNSSK